MDPDTDGPATWSLARAVDELRLVRSGNPASSILEAELASAISKLNVEEGTQSYIDAHAREWPAGSSKR